MYNVKRRFLNVLYSPYSKAPPSRLTVKMAGGGGKLMSCILSRIAIKTPCAANTTASPQWVSAGARP
jgi:hypothetical protein